MQVWHTCIWGLFPILLCRSSQALSDWMGASLHRYFQVSPEIFDWVQVRILAGPLLRCLGCVLRVVVLLEGEKPKPAEETQRNLEIPSATTLSE